MCLHGWNKRAYLDLQHGFEGKSLIKFTKTFLISVTQSFDTGLETIGPITLLSDGTVAFWGNEEDTYKLKQYNPHTGTERTCVNLSGEPWGNAEIKLAGKATLALSYG